MTPNDARASLAAAHTAMPPDDIADHALALVQIVASQDEAAETLLAHIARLERALAIRDDAITAAHDVLRTAHRLNAAGRKRDARNLIAEAVTVTATPDPLPQFDRTSFVRADVAWPDIFSPEGSA